MAKVVGRTETRPEGRRIRSVTERVRVAQSDGERGLTNRLSTLKAEIAEIDPTMLSALKRCEKRCDGGLLDAEALKDLADRATSKRSMDAFEKIAASDVFDQGLQKHLSAISNANDTVAAAPKGEPALDLDFFTGKDGIAKIAVKEDGKVDDAGSAVLRYVGRRHSKSMTTEARGFMADFVGSYQADLQAAQYAEQRTKDAQAFLDSENEASLVAWEQDRSTADKIRDDSSNFNQGMQNVKARRDVHVEKKVEVKEHRAELNVEKEEHVERVEDLVHHEAHQDVKEVEDDFRDGAGRVTKSEGLKRGSKQS